MHILLKMIGLHMQLVNISTWVCNISLLCIYVCLPLGMKHPSCNCTNLYEILYRRL